MQYRKLSSHIHYCKKRVMVGNKRNSIGNDFVIKQKNNLWLTKSALQLWDFSWISNDHIISETLQCSYVSYRKLNYRKTLFYVAFYNFCTTTFFFARLTVHVKTKLVTFRQLLLEILRKCAHKISIFRNFRNLQFWCEFPQGLDEIFLSNPHFYTFW